MTSRHLNTTFGIVGGAFLVLFCLGMVSPERTNSLVGPHGLLFWGGMLMAAIILPTVAGIRGSKWWLVLAGLSTITTIGTLVLALK